MPSDKRWHHADCHSPSDLLSIRRSSSSWQRWRCGSCGALGPRSVSSPSFTALADGRTDGWPLHDHSQPFSSNAEHEGCAGSCPWAAHSPPSRALLFQGQRATDPGNCPAPSQRMDAGQTIPDLRCATLEEPLWMAGTQRPDAATAEGNRSLSPSSLREILPSLGRPGERMAPGPRYRVPTPGPTSTNATRRSLL